MPARRTPSGSARHAAHLCRDNQPSRCEFVPRRTGILPSGRLRGGFLFPGYSSLNWPAGSCVSITYPHHCKRTASARGARCQPVFLDQELAIEHTKGGAASTVCKGNNGVTFPVLHAGNENC